MGNVLKTFDASEDIVSKDDAILYDSIIGESGIHIGCELTVLTGNQVSLAPGRGIIKGRIFVIEDQTVLNCALATSGTMKGRIYARMNLSDVVEPFQILTIVAATLPDLVKDENCNLNNGIYELELGTYDASLTSVSNLKNTYPKITNNIRSIKNQIGDIQILPITQANYDALAVKSETTLYLIKEA